MARKPTYEELELQIKKLEQESIEHSKINSPSVISEEKYRIYYDNIPLPCQSLDYEGCFLDVNNTWLELLGYEREEIIGKSYADFIHPDHRQSFEKNFPEFKRRGYVHGVQYKIRKKDGRYLEISFEGTIVSQP